MTRGTEIVYCLKCALRLTGRDFEAGSALRFADFSCCAPCSRVLLESMSRRRQKAFAELIERTHAETTRRLRPQVPRG